MKLTTSKHKNWQRPEVLLLLLAMGMPLSYATWMGLLNNFAIERAAFTGAEMGVLQSLREVPGFLAFTIIFVLLLVREQSLALLGLACMGIGTALTGFFPTILGLYITTVIMSVGFHYYETLQQSLALQWIDKKHTAQAFGRLIAAGSFAGLVCYGMIYIAYDVLGLDYRWVYVLGGGATVFIVLLAWLAFPRFEQPVEQNKKIVLRKRYWLYYALVFMQGARRQIFVVFAGFLMVEKFGYGVGEIAILFFINGAVSIVAAPRIGRLIGRWGERRALSVEYCGLIVVFTGYALVENATVAAGLYIFDHVFFAMAIAVKTYFQKIADPADIAPTAGISFTISHIVAVFLPAAYGLLWLVSPPAVFATGAVLATVSLLMARNIPVHPEPGNEVLRGRISKPAPAAAAE